MSLLLQQRMNLLYKEMLISGMETRKVENVDRDSTNSCKHKNLRRVGGICHDWRVLEEKQLKFFTKTLTSQPYLPTYVCKDYNIQHVELTASKMIYLLIGSIIS